MVLRLDLVLLHGAISARARDHCKALKGAPTRAAIKVTRCPAAWPVATPDWLSG